MNLKQCYGVICWTVVVLAAGAPFVLSTKARGHNGRRFLIEVVDNKLQVQGINSGMPDGAPPSRPYLNSIHDHWQNVPANPSSGLGPLATSFLPDYGIQISTSFVLNAHRVELELLSAWQWVAPPVMVPPGTVPDLQPLDPGEVIRIETSNVIDTDSLGTLLLSESVPPAGIDDILVNYYIERHPIDEIHVMEFQLSATPADPSRPSSIVDSDPIYVLMGPDGDNPADKRHHAALYLAEYLASHPLGVPEPSTLALAGLAGTLLMGVRRRASH